MGYVWLLRTDNYYRFHLPVEGDDVNTPDTAIEVGMAQALAINRCYSQPIVVNHPTLGQFTINMMPSGITGSCNQCGHCCTHLVENCPNPDNCGWPYRSDINAHACQYLVIDKVQKWPQANNSQCSLYATILDNFKGCAYPPDTINPLWINCGYSEI